MEKLPRVLAVTVLVIVSILFGLYDRFGTEGKSTTAATAYVERVGDGDTVNVRIGTKKERIRLIGIDAPEMGQKPWGERAKKHLEELLSDLSWTVMLEYDVIKRDRYGRLLAYLKARDGRILNEEMLKDGYAILYTFPPNVRYVERFTAAEQQARTKKAGIWSGQMMKETPQAYRKSHPRHN